MNRRTFLATSAAALAATALAETPATRRIPKKAVNLNMVTAKEASVGDKFKMVRDAGFDGIELNRPDAIPIDELLKARDASGLTVAGVICSTHWGKPLSSNDPTVREQGIRGVKLALQDCGELGCERMLLVPGVVDKKTSYDDCYKRSQAAIKDLAGDAEKAKCKIAVENVWNHFIMTPLEAARYLDEINSPWVGWHFDIGNVITYGWPEQWVHILGKRIFNLHIKEFSRKRAEEEGLRKGFDVELGEGDVGWPDVMKALDEIGYKGWGILEVKGGDAERLKFLAERTDKIFAS
jgi:L-ribulose-5-phosphate 3-epimerase